MLQLTTITRDHLTHLYREHMTQGFLQMRRQEVDNDIRELGADSYDLLLPETHVLPLIIDLNERILGIIYGRYKMAGVPPAGRGALVATDKRILLIDRKPLYLKCQEIAYQVIGGITSSWLGPMGTVTLSMPGSDIRLRTFNHRCTETFVQAVESRLHELSAALAKGVADDHPD